MSFLFIFPYLGFYANRQFENITARPVNPAGLSPQNPLNLIIFAVLSVGGVGLLVKGFF